MPGVAMTRSSTRALPKCSNELSGGGVCELVRVLVCVVLFMGVCVYVFVCVCLSAFLFVSVCVSVCLSVRLSVCLPVCLSVCLSFCLLSFGCICRCSGTSLGTERPDAVYQK